MTIQKSLTAGLVLALGLFLGSTSFAQEHDQRSMTAQWWQFAVSIPPQVNPNMDSTGVDCMVGQHGPVWFMAGTFGGTATRTCSIPEGVSLFFPVINYMAFNTPNICGQGGPVTVKEEREQASQFIDEVTNESVQVDGQDVENPVRVRSRVFAISIPARNIYNRGCGGPGTQPAGVFSPAVDDGYYVFVHPLSVGNHTLHIHGEVPSYGFVLDVTYNLTVVPVRLHD